MEDMEYERKQIGKRMNELRKAKGFKSAASFARHIGLTERNYSRLEKGDIEMRLPIAIAIADALDCSIDELIGREVPFDGKDGVSSAPAPVLKAISKANDSGIKLLADVSKVILSTPELLK